MKSDISWALRLASLSWAHPSFCGHSFFKLADSLKGDFCWGQIQKKALELRLCSKPFNVELAEALYQKHIVHRENQFLSPLDENYPESLLQSSRPPCLIHVKGSPVWKSSKGVSVVGSRKLLSQSKDWLHSEMAEWVRQSELFVISGGAIGVDQEAHKMALRNSVPTVVVLPTGLEQLYPKVLKSMESVVVQNGGALVSQFPPDKTIRSGHFHLRNRFLVALSFGLVVVQAARRSGSYMSALMALEEGRVLGAVPGHPLESQFGGCLDLIADGAQVLRTRQDLEAMTF